ncbi:MAG: PIN domain nuclease [Anaerolineae bacterium]|nr:PIN domain nuclease [Anaerolineae bacterium]MBL8105521.1 PIN domain nuclease [Anaerolineales bacterium]MCC7190010.1 PIN domain nuclease [Anaerolineales bacterium]
MLLVDTSVWVDYFNGIENPQTDYLHENLDRTPILVGDLILAEILQGFRSESDFEKVRRVLGKFIQADMVGTELAVQSARNFRFLRQKGITVRKTIDSLIATFCIENDHQLIHNDSDFDGYEKHLGLQVVHP